MADVRLSFYLAGVDDFINIGFRYIDIWRSEDDGATFYQITSDSEEAPEIEGSTAGPWNLDGQTFKAYLDGVLYQFQFSGAGDWDVDRIDGYLRQRCPIRAREGSDGKIVLYGHETGPSHYLVASNGQAMQTLGFQDQQAGYGKGIRPSLSSGQQMYTYYDSTGQQGWRYRYRLLTSAGSYSRWSDTTEATDGYVLDDDDMCLGTIDLVDQLGQPVEGAVIVVGNYWGPFLTSAGGKRVVSFRRVAVTDEDGHAQLYLVRGIELDLTVWGLPIRRRITVPDQDTVDLLDPSISVTPDSDTAAEFDIPTAVTHS